VESEGELDAQSARLIRAVREYAAAFTAAADEGFGTDHLNNPQLFAIAALARGRGLATGELARVAQVNRRTLNEFIQQLEAVGLVEMASDPADRRVRLVQLSTSGVAAVAEARKRLAAFFDEAAPLAQEIADLTAPRSDAPLSGRSSSARQAVSADARAASDPLDLAVMIAQVGMDFSNTVRQRLDDMGLHGMRGPRMHILSLLRAHGVLRPGSLSQSLRRSASTVTYLVNLLEQDGLVERSRDSAADGRAVSIRLTDAGRAAADTYVLGLLDHRDSIHARFSSLRLGVRAA